MNDQTQINPNYQIRHNEEVMIREFMELKGSVNLLIEQNKIIGEVAKKNERTLYGVDGNNGLVTKVSNLINEIRLGRYMVYTIGGAVGILYAYHVLNGNGKTLYDLIMQ